ncbi:Uu.00g001530.m01.CDS01 [Anthostomella pinea]|uniref:Mitochondrial-processing peptidase subunit alpha n=1 Tax=Anthostomella pinea TaxID=933095 RepID=A0AAI8VJB2_9PEZI|nr:Uu.00g001530.m01.CDS01 [Anthostomella pinea]
MAHHPELKRLKRKYEKYDLERFDHFPSTQASVGGGTVGKVQVDCRFLFKKSRWGVLGEPSSPAGIIYMDLNFSQPKDCRLKSATVTVTLNDESPMLGQHSRRTPRDVAPPPPPSPPMLSRHRKTPRDVEPPLSPSPPDLRELQHYPWKTVPEEHPVQLTPWFGPHHLAGQPQHMSKVKRYHLRPHVEVGGLMGFGGIGTDSEKTFAQESRWTFAGQLLPGKRTCAYKVLEWELTENVLEQQSIRSNVIHTAFSFQHSGEPVYMRVEVSGKLESLNDRFKHKLSRFPTNRNKDERCVTTLINFGDCHRFRQPLDELAQGLALAMQEENLREVPIVVPNPQIASFKEENTAAGRLPTDAAGRTPQHQQGAIDDQNQHLLEQQSSMLQSILGGVIEEDVASSHSDPTEPTEANLANALVSLEAISALRGRPLPSTDSGRHTSVTGTTFRAATDAPAPSSTSLGAFSSAEHEPGGSGQITSKPPADLDAMRLMEISGLLKTYELKEPTFVGITTGSQESVRRWRTRVDVKVKDIEFKIRPLGLAGAMHDLPLGVEPTELDQVTTLPNGVRVASEALPGSFSGVGVYIEAGSRFENAHLSGVSHIVDRLAFQSTTNKSGEELQETVESLGGNIQCVSSRESMMYQAATFNSAIPTATELLANTIQNAQITDEEVAQELITAEYEINEIWKKPELILPELVHMAAFKDNTLGNPLLCPMERITQIDKSVVRSYRDAFYRPERTVVAFAGVAHADAVRLATEFFGDMKSSGQALLSRSGSETSIDSLSSASESSSSSESSTSASITSSQQSPSLLSKIPLFKNLSTSASNNAAVLSSSALQPTLEDMSAPAHYTGGFVALPTQPQSPNPLQPNFTHIHLAFEGLPIASDDIYALATLNTLLGGGGSFSAGGPGKGMYSRLYTNVLNQHAWVESCIAFNHSYTDSGLFGISGLCIPGRTQHMLDVMCQELRALTLDTGFAALGEAEVQRAKNQLRSSLLMNLESRMVELEDLGRQVQVHGRKVPVHEMCRKIENLTVKDLRRVAKQVVGGLVQNNGKGSGAPTVVLQEADAPGVSAKQMTWEEIQDRIYRWGLGKR